MNLIYLHSMDLSWNKWNSSAIQQRSVGSLINVSTVLGSTGRMHGPFPDPVECERAVIKPSQARIHNILEAKTCTTD